MSFPAPEVINNWFQNAHTAAVQAGGSVYVMEKHAEQEVVKDVLRWAYVNMLVELEDLNYPADSRVRIRVVEMLTVLYDMTPATDEDDELVDDYIDDEDEDEDEDASEKPSIEVDTDLAIEIVGALLKAITSK